MQSLLYSEEIEENDFETRSVKCLAHHIIKMNQS